MKTDRTDKEAFRILQEFGPNNNGRFAAMADFARILEKENQKLLKQIEALTIPTDEVLSGAFFNGYWDGRNNQPAKNIYKAEKFVEAYNNGFHSGQAERQNLD